MDTETRHFLLRVSSVADFGQYTVAAMDSSPTHGTPASFKSQPEQSAKDKPF